MKNNMTVEEIRYKFKNEMKEKPEMRILIIWFFFSLLGLIFIKMFIRSGYIQLPDSFDFYQGTLPIDYYDIGMTALGNLITLLIVFVLRIK